MTLLGLIVLVIIGAICGALGQALAGYSFGGFFVSVVVGVVGAYLGYWLAGQLGLPEIFAITIEGKTFPVVWSIIGSAILATVLGLLMRRRVYI